MHNKNKNFVIFQLQRHINKTTNWIAKWRLRLNIAKTEVILFGTSINNPDKKLPISNVTINWVSEVKYLGILLDKKLTFNAHSKYRIKKA